MATRLRTKQLPSGWAFLRLDDTLTGADRYVSVRDLQTIQANHNILIARRVRRPIFSLMISEDKQALSTSARNTALNLDEYTRFQEEGLNLSNDYFMEVPFDVSPLVDKLELTIDHVNAGTGGGTDTVDVFVEIASLSTPGMPSTVNQVQVSGTAKHNLTIDIPHDLRGRGGPAWFRMNVVSTPTGSDLKGGGDDNVVEAQRYYLEIDNNTGAIGDLMYIKSGGAAVTSIAPRLVVDSVAVGVGGNNRYYVDVPYGEGEVNDTHDVNFRSMQVFRPQTISLYELGITSFFALTEPATI